MRTGNMAKAKLWSSPSAFATRANFRTSSLPAQLLIDDVNLKDEGVYRCRVDFRNSPTRNLRINFTVIGKMYSITIYDELPLKMKLIAFPEPPDRPVILDGRRGARTKLVEPYNEGSDVTLVCEVSGGELEMSLNFYCYNCKS